MRCLLLDLTDGGLLSAGRPAVGWGRAHRHHESVSLSDEHRVGGPARLPGRYARGQARDPVRTAPGILGYPVSDYDGTWETRDWANLPKGPTPPAREEETQWVVPEKFVDVLADAPPLHGEEARYAQVLAVLDAASRDRKLKEAMTEGAKEAD